MSWLGELIIDFHNWYHSTSKIKAELVKDSNPLRIGVLAAASINYSVIIDTTQTHSGALLTGIAARQKSKAEAQITKYKLGSTCKAYGSYEDLLSDPSIDAVYVPTPNGLHAVWAIKALEAGKHVLIEKPIASNANEVRQIQETAQRTGKVALEAFHWRYHPAAHRVKEIVQSEQYGAVTEIFTDMNLPKGTVGMNDMRFNYKLGGGASMDLTYVYSASSYYGMRDPLKADMNVISATSRVHQTDKKVDEAMHATFIFKEPGKKPVTCKTEADLALPNVFFGLIPQFWRLSASTRIGLERAEIEFANFPAPYISHTITIKEKDTQGKFTGKQHVEKCYVDGPQWKSRGKPFWTTYRYQLEAFVDMIKAKESGTEYQGPWMSLEESEKLMGLIDSVYDKAGLPRRGL